MNKNIKDFFFFGKLNIKKNVYLREIFDHAPSHARAALIRSTVHLIRLLTVATEPRESLAVGTESTRI